MPWESHSFGVPTRRLLCSTAIGLALSLPSGTTRAACDNPATVGPDTRICSGANANINGNDGNDTLVLVDDGTATAMQGQGDNDTVFLSSGSVSDSLSGGAGEDVIIIGGSGAATVSGGVTGNGGNDVIRLNNGGSVADIFGENGDDLVSITGGIGGDVFGGNAKDTLIMIGGQVDAFFGEDGDDWAYVAGATIVGSGGTALDGGEGDDTIDIASSDILGSVFGGTGHDEFSLSALGFLDGDIYGGKAGDRFDLNGGTLTGNAAGESGQDFIKLSGTSVLGSLDGGEGKDTFFISAGTASAVIGGDNSDTLVMTGGQIGLISGGDNDDTLEITGGTVTDGIHGDKAGDLITLSGDAVIAGGLFGGSGGDEINLRSVAGFSGVVSGDEGNDTLTLFGVLDAGTFDGAVLAGVTTLTGGAGNQDLINFNGVVGKLPVTFEEWEDIWLGGYTTLDVFDGVNDVRGIDANLGIFPESVLVAAGNSPGSFTLNGDFGLFGTLEMADGAADDQVTINGNFSNGAGGVVELDAALDASATADVLVIQGDVTDVTVGGLLFIGTSTGVQVQDVGSGQGVLTGTGPGAGIRVIDVSNSGNTNSGDFFLVGGPIQAGAVQYDLVLESDGIWYLQSSLIDAVFGYSAAPSAALAMGQDYLGTLRQRVGTREQSWSGGATQSSDGSGVWLRGGGSSYQVKDGSGFDYDQDHWFAQLGADLPLLVDAAGSRLIGGLFAHYGTSDVEAKDDQGADAARITLDAWGGGLSLTWYGEEAGAAGEGPYADLVGQVTFYDADFKSEQGSHGSTDGWGWGVSLEAGWGFTVADKVRLIPQAQLTYSRVSLDDLTDSIGIEIDYGSSDSLEGRLGLAVDSGKLWRSGNVTFTASLVHEFLGESDVTASGLDVGTDLAGTAAEVGMAATVSLLDNVSLYGSLDYRVPFDQGREGIKAEAGIRLSW